MFHCFGSMCGFLLSIIRCEDIDDGHEIDLLLRGTCMEKTTGGWGTPITPGNKLSYSHIFLDLQPDSLRGDTDLRKGTPGSSSQRVTLNRSLAEGGGKSAMNEAGVQTPQIPTLSRSIRGWLGRVAQLLLTFMAFHGIDVDRGVELAWSKEPGEAEEVARAIWRCAVGAEQAAAHPIILTLLVLGSFFHLHLLLLCPVHIVDAHQQTVVHDLQLGKELRRGEQEDGRKGYMGGRSGI